MDCPQHFNSGHVIRDAMRLILQAQQMLAQVIASGGPETDMSAEDQELMTAIGSYNAAQDLAVPDEPGVTARAEMHGGVPLESIGSSQDERIRRQDSFTQFERKHELFTKTQWEVICLYYRDGLNDEQIGQLLNRTGNAIYKRRQRAEHRLEERNHLLRKEKIAIASKYIKL